MSVVTGKCRWAKLLTPSEEDGTFKSKYSIDLYDLSDADIAQLKKENVESKVDKNGEVFYRFWSSGKYKGVQNPPIRLKDKHGNQLNEEPGNGSLVKVQYAPTDWTFLKKKGVFGALQGVKVLNLISRVADELGDDEVEDDDIPF